MRGTLSACVVLALLPTAAAGRDWPQQMVGTTQASGLDGSGIVVAVLDSGIDHTHPDLAGKFWQNPKDPANGLDDDLDGHADDVDGWDFCHEAPPRQVPGYWHGTFVAGVLAGSEGHGGVRGAAPNVRLMDVQVYCDNDTYPAPDGLLGRDSLRQGLRYAIDHGADIILLSLQLWTDHAPGTVAGLLPAPEEFEAAHDAGILLVGAAGNQGASGPGQPGARPHVLAVGATTGCGFRHGLSNHGIDVDLWAPGRAYASVLGGGHRWEAGTSYAAPLVAGAAALHLQKEPRLAPDDVAARLLQAAAPSADGPVLDVHGLLGVPREAGAASLRLVGSTAVRGPHYLQYESSGSEPSLLQVHSEGYGDWCFNLADETNQTFYVDPGADARLQVQVAARAIGPTWSGPWLNLTFTNNPEATPAAPRPLLGSPDGALQASKASPWPPPLVTFGLAALLRGRAGRPRTTP